MSLAMYRRIVYTYCNELEKKNHGGTSIQLSLH